MASKNTKQQPFLNQKMISTLSNGWRTAVTSDGKIYFQNDITKQTQWQPPNTTIQQPMPHGEASNDIIYVAPNSFAKTSALSAQQTTITTQSTSKTNQLNEDDLDEVENDEARSLFHKEHLLWLFTAVVGIYDYITDIQVAISWFNLSTLCQQFTCETANERNASFIKGAASFILFPFSSIGFIGTVLIKMIELKSLYLTYKYPVTKADVNEKEHEIWKTTLKWGWIPLIIEDAVSVTITSWVYNGSGTNWVIGLSNIYLQSLSMGLFSIVFNLLNTYRKKRKLQKLNLFENERRCHCCWCCCMCCCFVPIFTIVLLYIAGGAFFIQRRGYVAYVDLINMENSTQAVSNDWRDNQCGFYTSMEMTDYIKPEDKLYIGEVIHSPHFIYEDCSGQHYEYELICAQHKNTTEKILQCDLSWQYMYMTAEDNKTNISDVWDHDDSCYTYADDYCIFNIDLGVCENYIIQCNNFEFYEGNPVMWACFDYCTV